MKRAKELGNVECIYKGPMEHEPATEVQIIQDLITQKVDGMAISVADVAAMTESIKAARGRHPGHHLRCRRAGLHAQAYIGTNNKELGLALGQMLLKVQPHAGQYAMVSGGPAAANLAERVDGVRDVLKARTGPRWRARRPSATTTPPSPCSR